MYKREKYKTLNKIFIGLLLFITIFTILPQENLAVEEDTEEIDITSRIALIYDRASGKILYEKNGNKQTPMASTTKIMTAIVEIGRAHV